MAEQQGQGNRSGPVVLILAAGRGERFLRSGGTGSKLDAPLAGTPVLQHVEAAVATSGLAHVTVRQADGSGMGDTIAAGVRQTAQASGWLVLPGDLPLISPATLQAVARQLEAGRVVVPWVGQTPAHPVGFPAVCGPLLAALTGEHGARGIVKALRGLGRVMDMQVADRGAIMDVDTREDLDAVREVLRQAADGA